MVLEAASGQKANFYVVNGVRYPALLGSDGEALPIRGAPDEAFPAPLTLGDPARATDQRVASLVLGDWRDGAGQFRYPAAQGAASFTTFAYSDGDTRWKNALVQRPNPATMTNTLTTAAAGQRFLYTGYATASILSHYWGGARYRYDPTGGGWIASAPNDGCYGMVRGLGGVYATTLGNVAVTTDGVTWTNLANTGFPGVLLLTGTLYGIAKHDNKLYVIYLPTGTNTATVYYSTNFGGTPAAVTWTAGGSFYVETSSEYPVALLEWRDRYGRRALFCMTQRQLLGYDDDSNTWQFFEDLGPLGIAASSAVCAYVWNRDDNLYITVGSDVLYRFTGQEIDILGPNINGGVPAGQQTQLTTITGNTRYLFVAGAGGTVDSASHGGTWAMNAQDGWHRLYSHATKDIYGCGWGNGKLWTAVFNSGATANVIEQKVPDQSDNPLNATSSQRDYDATNTTSHITALFDGGAPNIPFQPLSVEVICKKMNARDLGLLAGCQVPVYYRTNSSGGWVSLGTLTSASAFPARLQINGGLGVLCNDLEVRLDLITNSTSQTPVVTDVIVHYLRQPMIRAQYTCQLDLRDTNPVFRQDAAGLPGPLYTQTAADLRKALYAVAGLSATVSYRAQVVPFSYGAGPIGNGPNAVALAASLLRISSVEDPLLGYGVMTLAVIDVSTAPSG